MTNENFRTICLLEYMYVQLIIITDLIHVTIIIVILHNYEFVIQLRIVVNIHENGFICILIFF